MKLNWQSILCLAVFLVSSVSLLFVLSSNLIAEYLLAYGIPISILVSFSLLSLIFALRK
ncbi:hypothetical protein [Bacillus sp. P14.5]|uniref:hypothetical protein n=1 Tax=Bacillus sp. P14.5 TaxID=1983400 RepID=UPI0013B06722|nr:hypothetical protein [Bacillus sp. P14.5]